MLMPCGACRQLLAEFTDPETVILVDRAGTYQLKDLLPNAFRLISKSSE
jgi:cytidine deaminase